MSGTDLLDVPTICNVRDKFQEISPENVARNMVDCGAVPPC